MRALNPDLITAQRVPGAPPYLRVEASDRSGSVQRLHFTRYYTGAEDDEPHDVAYGPTNKALTRIKVDTATHHLWTETISGVATNSPFGSSWVDREAVQAGTDVTICSNAANQLVLCYVHTDDVTIKSRASTDGGFSWAAAVNVVVAASAVTHLSITHNGTEYTLFYSTASQVHRIKRTAGVWGAATAWTNTAATITGVAAHWWLDHQLVVTGTDAAGDAYLWHLVLGDGFTLAVDTWGSLNVIERASSGSTLTFNRPYLERPDVLRLSFHENYSGSVAYARNATARQPLQAGFGSFFWSEPAPFEAVSNHGWALATDTTNKLVWLTNPFGVWAAPYDVAAVDLTQSVDRLTIDQSPADGSLRLILVDPTATRGPDPTWPPSPLTLGAQLAVSPGYLTPTGPKTASGMAFWIESFSSHIDQGGRLTSVIDAIDGWGLLARWTARRQFQWAAGAANVGNIIAEILARAGMSLLSSATSPAFVNLYPAFTIQPGEDGRSAIRRLLQMVEDVLFLEGETAWASFPQASDPSTYTFAGPRRTTDPVGALPIIVAEYLTSALSTNQHIVAGLSAIAEATDQAASEYVGV
ncbi:MAG: hypothetical protein AAB289_11915, partial [Chloroflexota bacterium]